MKYSDIPYGSAARGLNLVAMQQCTNYFIQLGDTHLPNPTLRVTQHGRQATVETETTEQLYGQIYESCIWGTYTLIQSKEDGREQFGIPHNESLTIELLPEEDKAS